MVNILTVCVTCKAYIVTVDRVKNSDSRRGYSIRAPAPPVEDQAEKMPKHEEMRPYYSPISFFDPVERL